MEKNDIKQGTLLDTRSDLVYKNIIRLLKSLDISKKRVIRKT